MTDQKYVNTHTYHSKESVPHLKLPVGSIFPFKIFRGLQVEKIRLKTTVLEVTKPGQENLFLTPLKRRVLLIGVLSAPLILLVV